MVTSREPDRFEEKAREVVNVVINCMNGKTDHAGCRTGDGVDHVAAALRAEHEDGARDARSDAYDVIRSHIKSPLADVMIRALASPAAAPAAETGKAICVKGHITNTPLDEGCHEPSGEVERLENGDVELGCGERVTAYAPPSEPAAPEKEIANLLGRGHVRNPREGEPGDAETYSSPAPLLPRVLAALEREADATTCAWFRSESQGLRSLAAELRAYIAKREPAEKHIAELEAALRDTLNAAHHHVQAGQHWICSEPFASEEDCPCAKLAARAAKASASGDGSAET